VFSVRVSVSPARPTCRRECLAERGIHFLEHGARERECISQGLAHTDGLAALARKRERRGHERPCNPLFSEIGPKDTA
jgi:hypothetical protein